MFSACRKEVINALRDDYHDAHYLYYLASVVKASHDILEKLKTHNVYCVRYLIDTVVSHRTMGLDVELSYDLGFTQLAIPDTTLFVHIDEVERQQRITARGKSTLDMKLDDVAFRQTFIAQFERLASHFTIIDNSSTLDICITKAKQIIQPLIR